MKSEKGMSHRLMVVYICLLIIIAATGLYFFTRRIKSEVVQTVQTDMLLTQGKVKVLSQESVVKKDEGVLKGEKLSEKLEDERIKKLVEKQIINTEEDISKFYVWSQEILNEVGLGDIKLEDELYIVNYDTDEVIYTKGINYEGETLYKMSEINKKTSEGTNEIEDTAIKPEGEEQ